MVPVVSVVVPSRNGASRIVPLLDSLASQSIEADKVEITVVDDGSTDGTSAVVAEFAATPSSAPDSMHPAGTWRGEHDTRNTGIRASYGRYLSLLDDDEIAPPDHLFRLVELLHERQDVHGAGGPALVSGDSRFTTCDRCSIGEARLPIDSAGPTKRLLGGNMTVRRKLFDEVGPFDEAISGRGDETEWFMRADRTFWYDESLFVWHRRDHMSLVSLLGTGFCQGRSMGILSSGRETARSGLRCAGSLVISGTPRRLDV